MHYSAKAEPFGHFGSPANPLVAATFEYQAQANNQPSVLVSSPVSHRVNPPNLSLYGAATR